MSVGERNVATKVNYFVLTLLSVLSECIYMFLNYHNVNST